MEVKSKKPPGKRLLKNMPLRLKWLLSATTGLLFVCYGLCTFSEAAYEKHTNAPFMRWFLLGIYSLIVICGGLSIFGQAIIFKSQMKNRKMINKILKRKKKRSKHSNNMLITPLNPNAKGELKPTFMKPSSPEKP
jgi:hypothetical protein